MEFILLHQLWLVRCLSHCLCLGPSIFVVDNDGYPLSFRSFFRDRRQCGWPREGSAVRGTQFPSSNCHFVTIPSTSPTVLIFIIIAFNNLQCYNSKPPTYVPHPLIPYNTEHPDVLTLRHSNPYIYFFFTSIIIIIFTL